MKTAQPPTYKHQYTVCRKKVVHISTGEVYGSVEELAAKIGWKVKDLRRRISGERPNTTPYQYNGDLSKIVKERKWIPRKGRWAKTS